MTDLKHTITPWKIIEQDGEATVTNDHGDDVCDNTDLYPMPVAIDNMKFIVLAANNHQPMIDILQRILDADFGWGGAVSENEVHQLLWKAKGETLPSECRTMQHIGNAMMGPSRNGSKNCANAEDGFNGSIASGGTTKYCTCDVCF